MSDQDEPRDEGTEPTPETPDADAEGVGGGEDAAVAEGAAGPQWLRDLEERVREAVARLHELGEERDRLQDRVGELEAALEEERTRAAEAESRADEAEVAAEKARKAAEAARAAEPSDGADAAAWREERDEIRDRVQRLTGDLESLLGEG